MIKKFLLLTLIPLLLSCGEKRGFDLAIENTIESNFTLLLNISDEKGHQLVSPFIHISGSNKKDAFRYSNFDNLNYNFAELTVKAELFSSENGELIDSKIAQWPGKAGMSSSAGSNRITIELGLDKIDDKVKLSFRSVN